MARDSFDDRRDAPPARLSPLLYQETYRISSARLKHFDYASGGLYFVTINAYQHRCLFGVIESQAIIPSRLGELVTQCWMEIPTHFPHVALDRFQLMPNHLHGILWFIRDGEGYGSIPENGKRPGGMQKGSLSTVVNSFKGAVTYQSRQNGLVHTVWQSRFHDHVIRDQEELARIREYIVTNPAQWEADRYYSNAETVRERGIIEPERRAGGASLRG